MLNRPRNRQPRRGDHQTGSPRPNRGGGGARGGRSSQHSAPRPNGNVPGIHQVIPGASVWIVLKEDQPTGDQTHGIIAQVLTRGNHPRGIKVKLRDGQVGRVQRMGAPVTETAATTDRNALPPSTMNATSTTRFTHRYTDVRYEDNDDYASEPPPRSLADYFPDEPEPPTTQTNNNTTVTATCPICDAFEGDDIAVSHHVEREH